MQLISFRQKNRTPFPLENSPSVVGRSFILGLPDTRGWFHIALHNKLWNIEPGSYKAGDRVQVMAVDAQCLIVEAMRRTLPLADC